MTQPSLLDLPAVRRKVHRRVRETSKAQYAVGREQFTGRKGFVLRVLAHYYNRFQVWPTSAELASQDDDWSGIGHASWDAQLLFVRRGLSDLQTTGNVEGAGKRTCSVSGRTVETWRVTPR